MTIKTCQEGAWSFGVEIPEQDVAVLCPFAHQDNN